MFIKSLGTSVNIGGHEYKFLDNSLDNYAKNIGLKNEFSNIQISNSSHKK